MSGGLDVEQLKRKLESRFQLALTGQKETVDGGNFDTIRLSNLEQGNGFAILLARTHRQFEASFKADNFAGALFRMMSEADQSQKNLFFMTREVAESVENQVYVAINGNSEPDCLDLKDRWSSVEVDVYKRFSPSGSASDMMATAFQASSICLSLVLALVGSDDSVSTPKDNSIVGLPEGAKLRVEVNRYERSPVNRAACIAKYGLACQCCGFDFFEYYGDLGDDYIEVHHRTPVSQMGADYAVNPVQDLIPLCSNCHSIIHRTAPQMTVEELKSLIETRQSRRSLG